MFKNIFLILCVFSVTLSTGCHKKEFLDDKPRTDLFVPTTLDDFQLLLDNYEFMSETPVLGELSADNYYIVDQFFPILSPPEQNAYTWKVDIFNGLGNNADWNFSYQQVFYANVVLEGLDKVEKTVVNANRWDALKGSALFIRAYAFHNLAQIFAPVYDITTVDSPGIPIRLVADINERSFRSTIEQTYDQILSDLKESKKLLPTAISFSNLNRPSQPAALAIIARVYLNMRAYDKAKLYADSCLQLYNTLIDYNKLTNPNAFLPFNQSNSETLYQSRLITKNNVIKGVTISTIVDSVLYQSYDTNDIRRRAFFANNPFGPGMKGTYNGTIFGFSGPAVDEVYLIKAECNAREGNMNAAMNDLNTLLQNRWKTGTFVPYTATTPVDALNKVLTERRKELVFRGLRWTDLRRLNKEGRSIMLYRKKGGQLDSLPPNDSKYVLPIPPDVISMSNIPQNWRK